MTGTRFNTFYIACSGNSWLQAATILRDSAGWNPLYWVGSKRDENEVRKLYPQATFHEVISAVRGIKPLAAPEITPGVLDEKLLQELSWYETIVLKMMDRMDPGDAFGFRERIDFYHQLLRYWLGVIARYKPDIVVFSESPHMVFDYVLYALCRRLNIRTPMFESLLMTGWIMPMDSVEDGCTVIRENYQKRLAATNSPVALSPLVVSYVSRLRGDQKSAVPEYVKAAIEGQQRADEPLGFLNLWSKFISIRRHPLMLKQGAIYLSRAVHNGKRFLFDPAPPNYLKQKSKTIQASAMTGLQWRNYKRVAVQHKKRLRQEYDRLAGDTSVDRSYIFVALQYQPEKTSSPDGGVFVYQELLIQMLSAVIPQGWYVYVKENPGQFGKWHGERSRANDFYRTLIEAGNVRLVPMTTPTYDMIDGSRAVATVRGTAGWEAILRGKPALLFGKPWYQGCEGAFEVTTMNRCQAAIEQIEGGYTPDQKKVHIFLNAAEATAVRGFVSEKYGRTLGINIEENGRNIATSLRNFVAGTGESADES